MTKQILNFLKPLWPILLTALILRIFLATFTFHPDLRAFNFAGSLITSGNILNLYDYLASCAPDNPLLKTFGPDLFIYPPAIYLTHGIFNFIFSNLFGSDLINGHIIESADSFRNIWFNLHLFLIKFPYLIFDFLAAYFISRLFDDKRKQTLALVLWLFNPVSLYATYMMGQFDMIPAFFTILSLYFVKKDKLPIAALMLGIGAAYKLYPLFLLPPLLMLTTKRWRRILMFLLALLPYAILALPFITSHGFRSYALVAGLTQKTMYAKIPVSGGESILLFPTIVIAFYSVFYYGKNLAENLWQKQLIILLVFFILTHFHPQWLVWITPFVIIELVSTNFKHLKVILLMLVSFIASLFFFDTSLTLKIFSPLIPSLSELPADLSSIGLRLDINYYRSVLQSIFAAGAIYLIYHYLTPTKKQD